MCLPDYMTPFNTILMVFYSGQEKDRQFFGLDVLKIFRHLYNFGLSRIKFGNYQIYSFLCIILQKYYQKYYLYYL